jgi:hypothetical protein
MALTQASLSSKIQAEIVALYGVADDPSRLQDFADAIAKAVVDEIQANAVVSSTGTVTSGAGAGGAVVTTGTVA